MAETQNMPLDRATLAPVEGYSTADMMRKMCIGSNKLQSFVEEDGKFVKSDNFKQMVGMEHFAADNYNKSREETEELQQARRIVEGNIATLGSSKDPAVIASKNNFMGEYGEKSNRIADLEKERTQLLTETKAFRTTLANGLNKIAQEIGKRPDADIRADLNNLNEQLKSLTKRIKDLTENENKAAGDLHDLIIKTTGTVRNLGLPVTEAVVTPTRHL